MRRHGDAKIMPPGLAALSVARRAGGTDFALLEFLLFFARDVRRGLRQGMPRHLTSSRLAFTRLASRRAIFGKSAQSHNGSLLYDVDGLALS